MNAVDLREELNQLFEFFEISLLGLFKYFVPCTIGAVIKICLERLKSSSHKVYFSKTDLIRCIIIGIIPALIFDTLDTIFEEALTDAGYQIMFVAAIAIGLVAEELSFSAIRLKTWYRIFIAVTKVGKKHIKSFLNDSELIQAAKSIADVAEAIDNDDKKSS